jgi:hypothetical protein
VKTLAGSGTAALVIPECFRCLHPCNCATQARTEAGRNRSKLNALVHGCRANTLVLPTEDPTLCEERSHTWRLSLKPRNPAEGYMVDRMASLARKGERIDRAQMAQLTKRVQHAGVDAAHTELEQVISLGKQLLGDIHAARAVRARAEEDNPATNDEARSAPAVSIDPDHPMHLVLHLQTTVPAASGCWTSGQTCAPFANVT